MNKNQTTAFAVGVLGTSAVIYGSAELIRRRKTQKRREALINDVTLNIAAIRRAAAETAERYSNRPGVTSEELKDAFLNAVEFHKISIREEV